MIVFDSYWNHFKMNKETIREENQNNYMELETNEKIEKKIIFQLFLLEFIFYLVIYSS